MRRASLWAAVLSSVIAHNSALADDMNERIQIGISLIKLACGTGTTGQTLAVEKKSDSGVTLKALSSNGSEQKNEPKPTQKSVSFSKNEFQGLVLALNKEFTEAAANFSKVQMECMRPYVQRIFDLVIPPQKPQPIQHQSQEVAQRPPQQPPQRPLQGCQSAPSIRSVYMRYPIF